MKKPPLLLLCHRIPYPPNKGDKIRSYNMLKKLAETFEIYLAAFVDDPFDWQYAAHLEQFCADMKLLGQNKTWSKIKGITALATKNTPITLPYYANRAMQAWVHKIIAEQGIRHAFVYSSSMAQFIDGKQYGVLNRVIDFVDVDSDKWRQYAEGKRGISAWVYRREWNRLKAYESHIANEFNHSLFVSQQEAQLFRQQLPQELHQKVHGILNGADITFFDPNAKDIEQLAHSIDVVFTGAMDYWANVDAVIWFSKKVWPEVRQAYPNASFYVVGGNPANSVKALNNKNGIVVTGRVKDVRPYIRAAKVSVAPLQIARGIQNKILEAMAMEKAVVATSMAIEGIAVTNDAVDVVDNAQKYAQKVITRMARNETAKINRQWVIEHLVWDKTLNGMEKLFAVS